MTTRGLLRDGTSIARENAIVFVPPIVASVVFGLLSLLAHPAPGTEIGPYGPGMGIGMGPGAMIARGVGVAALTFVIGAIVALLAHGMTLAMVKQRLDGGSPTLSGGFRVAKDRIVPLAIAAVITGVLMSVGLMLLVLPGLIVTYLLLFTFAGVIGSGLSAPAAIKKSVELTTREFGESAVLFLIIVALGVVFAAASLLLNVIPFLGPVLSIVLGGLYTGYASILLLITYRRLEGPGQAGEEEPQPET